MPSAPMMFNHKHDHNQCVEEALEQARRICEKGGERFTDLRRQVFELIWAEHKPVKAYDLLSALSIIRSGVAPTTVYRTLDFLRSQGLVHKIESLNAYLGCSHPEQKHRGHFLICESCEGACELEISNVSQSIDIIEREQNFRINHMTVEISGICANCRQASGSNSSQ